jgi:hypothetical protein
MAIKIAVRAPSETLRFLKNCTKFIVRKSTGKNL